MLYCAHRQTDCFYLQFFCAPVLICRFQTLTRVFIFCAFTIVRATTAHRSWSTKPELVTLKIDYGALGMAPSQVKLVAPLIPAFNRANTSVVLDPRAPITVPALQGWLLVLQ